MELNKHIEDQKLAVWMKLAQGRCVYHMRDEVDAQDISQGVMIELLLNLATIKAPEAWIIKVARYKCYEFMRRKSAYSNMLGKLEAEMKVVSAVKLVNLSSQDKISFEKLVTNIPSDCIASKDKDLFMEYINCGSDLNILQKKFAVKPETLRKRIYTIRRDMIAWINLQRGITSGKKRILGEHLNKNILNFAQRFRECVESNNWQPLQRYLAPEVVIPENFSMPFYEIQFFEVFYLQNDEYRFTIAYYSKQKKASGYNVKVRIIRPHSIQVISFPKPVREIISWVRKGAPQELLDITKELPDGTCKATYKKIMELLKKHNYPYKVLFQTPKEKK
jgi:hypothetical protein